MLRNMRRSSFFASARVSGVHICHATGFPRCARTWLPSALRRHGAEGRGTDVRALAFSQAVHEPRLGIGVSHGCVALFESHAIFV